MRNAFDRKILEATDISLLKHRALHRTLTEEKTKVQEEKETGRLESFSDGLFAFAITLLVLNLRDPVQGATGSLSQGLISEWPAFFAFLTSFFTILIMWVNHHTMFNSIRKMDTRSMFLNGFLLLTVVLNPFTTMLVADHLQDSNASAAVGVYAGVFLFLSIVWNTLWRYASTGHRLLSSAVSDDAIRRANRDFNYGTLLYGVAFVLSFFSAIGSILTILGLAVFWAVSSSSRSPTARSVKNDLVS